MRAKPTTSAASNARNASSGINPNSLNSSQMKIKNAKKSPSKRHKLGRSGF
jgi:hypothetical protein